MSSAFDRQPRFFSKSRNRIAGTLLAALIFTFLLWRGVFTPDRFPYALEVSVQSDTPASTQIYFDRGAGLRETDSSSQRIGVGTTAVRLPLPPGIYKVLRFDPIDRAGRASFGALRIVGPGGALIRTVLPSELSPNDQIERVPLANGLLEMTSTDHANDPQFAADLDPAMKLEFGFFDQVVAARWWLLRWFAGCLIVLLFLEHTWRNRIQRARSLVALKRERPRLALALCAGVAAIISSYPVVFLGKSFVSPNTTVLLYDRLPTVPGYSDTHAEDVRGADVGAMMWQHLPYTVQLNHALRAGTLPLWNRFASCGVTLLGQGQSMFGDPLHLLVVAANGAPWAFDLKYVLVKALFGCGLGWCVWALTRDFAASAILTFGSVFIAFFNYRLNHPSIFTMGYAPWILVAWFHLVGTADRRSFRNALLLWYAANWMVLTSGTVKEAYLLVLSLNVTGALIFFTAVSQPGQKLRRGVILGLAAIAFILISAPLWWSLLEALSSSYTNYDAPRIIQNPGQWLIGLFDDLFYREFQPKHNVHKPAANFLVLLGFLWALLQPHRLFATRALVIVLSSFLAALALAFRFGPPSWAPTWVLAVPLLRNVYNLDTIFSCIALIHLCVLAGWGFSAARQPLAAGQAARYGWMMLAVVVALFAVYFGIAPSGLAEPHVWAGWSGLTLDQGIVYANVILLPLAASVLIYLAARHVRGAPLTYGAAAGAIVALVILLARHGQHLRFTPTTYIAAPGVRADLQIPSASVEFLQRHTKDEPSRVLGVARTFFPGFGTIYGLEVINGANALENRVHRQLVEAAGLVIPGNWIYEVPVRELPQWRPIADFLNVRYLIAPDSVPTPAEGYREAAALDLKVFESEHCWPRAFFTNRLEHYTTPAQLVSMIRQRAPGAPFAAMQESDPIPLPLPSGGAAATATVVPAHDYLLTTNTTAFTIVAPSAGLAVLHENWLPNDFRATLNGKPVPYLRVNHTFKGVLIPGAGTYRIEFAYWPRGLTIALTLAACGAALAIATDAAVRRSSSLAFSDPSGGEHRDALPLGHFSR